MNSFCTIWGYFSDGHHHVHSPWYTTNPYPLSATEIFKKFELGKLNWVAAETIRTSSIVSRQPLGNGCHHSLPLSSKLCGQTNLRYGCKGSVQSAFLCAVPHVFEPNTVIDCLYIAPESLKVNQVSPNEINDRKQSIDIGSLQRNHTVPLLGTTSWSVKFRKELLDAYTYIYSIFGVSV